MQDDPPDFVAIARQVEELRAEQLLGADDCHVGPSSKPHWFLAMAALETARWHFEACAVARAAELAAKPRY